MLWFYLFICTFTYSCTDLQEHTIVFYLYVHVYCKGKGTVFLFSVCFSPSFVAPLLILTWLRYQVPVSPPVQTPNRTIYHLQSAIYNSSRIYKSSAVFLIPQLTVQMFCHSCDIVVHITQCVLVQRFQQLFVLCQMFLRSLFLPAIGQGHGKI